MALFSKNSEIDLVTLRGQLNQQNMLADCGGVDYLVQLAEYVPSAANAVHYAGVVKDRACRRRLVEAAGKLVSLADGPEDATLVISQAQDILADVAQSAAVTGSVESIQSVLMKIANEYDGDDQVTEEDELSKAFGLGSVAIPSKHQRLNDIILGFDPGGVYVIGARSGMGKTSWAIDEACHMAQLGIPVLFVTREMTTEKLVLRFLAKLSRVPFRTIKRRMMSDAERYRFQEAQEQMYSLPMFFMSRTTTPIVDIKREARAVCRKLGKMPVIFDDFIQTGLPDGDVRVAVNRRMMDYKDIAKELKTPVIALSQLLGKGNDSKEAPKLKDLKESSAIEEQSDVVIFIHRPEYHDARDERRPEAGESEAEFIVAKNREGAMDVARLRFRPAFTEFL